jgi:hypothetical protein
MRKERQVWFLDLRQLVSSSLMLNYSQLSIIPRFLSTYALTNEEDCGLIYS